MTNSETSGPVTVWRRSKEIVFQQMDDELLAVDAQAGQCYSLNESAGRVWSLIETPASLATICAQLCTEYNVDEQTCMNEVGAVLQGLRTAGLVESDGNG